MGTHFSDMKIHYSIPRRVQQLTNITNKTLKCIGISFRAMMVALIDFLSREQAHSETIPIIIVNGGFLNDFLILLTNCVKHSYGNYSVANSTYVDSMLIFRNEGYMEPGLDAHQPRIQYCHGGERLSLCTTQCQTGDGYL